MKKDKKSKKAKNKAPELLPCPLCDSTAAYLMGTDSQADAIYCDNCALGVEESGKSYDSLKEMWNNIPRHTKMPLDNHLLPCPFCGGKEITEDASGVSEYDGHEHQDYEIICEDCNATMYVYTGNTEFCDYSCSCCNDTADAAREKWNSRKL